MLADASIVPAFIRLCGAKMGPGCVMGLQADADDPGGNGLQVATRNGVIKHSLLGNGPFVDL